MQQRRTVSLLALTLCLASAPERARGEPVVHASSPTEPTTTPPRTPPGLPACTEPLVPQGGATVRIGESIRYDVEVMGIDVGELQVQVARRGKYQGEAVTELRSLVQVNNGVAALVPLEGAAAALVTEAAFNPVQASNRYRWMSLRSSELQTYLAGGREVSSKRTTGDGSTERHRTFHAPVHDMLTGFYFLRRLSPESRGCSLLFSNGKAYTVWLEPEGTETLDTELGQIPATRMKVRYASDEASTVREARIWLSQDARRLPLKAEGLNMYRPQVRIKGYTP